MFGECAAALFASKVADGNDMAGAFPVFIVDRGASVKCHEGNCNFELAKQGVAVEGIDTVVLAENGEAVRVDSIAGNCRDDEFPPIAHSLQMSYVSPWPHGRGDFARSRVWRAVVGGVRVARRQPDEALG